MKFTKQSSLLCSIQASDVACSNTTTITTTTTTCTTCTTCTSTTTPPPPISTAATTATVIASAHACAIEFNNHPPGEYAEL